MSETRAAYQHSKEPHRPSGFSDEIPPHSDPESQVENQDHSKRTFSQRKSLIILIIATFTLLTYLAQSCLGCPHKLPFRSENPTTESFSHVPTSICGTNSRTARRNGCIFDPITFAWLPTHCVDQDLLSQYLETSDLTWYNHAVIESDCPKGRNPLPLGEVIAGRYDAVLVDQSYIELRRRYLKSQEAILIDIESETYTNQSLSKHWTIRLKESFVARHGGLLNLEAKYPICLKNLDGREA